ncbi:MAG: MBOAT family protein [Deltaproteobacteria bacterium]|nr:MBOAT family protein [Deltaproteobacteria bacterium]MBW2535970.1 MBOAT family protein [Deltaproteobacteria bacterium]
MLFNTLTYAWFFVVVFAAAWLLAPWRRARLAFLLVSSYVFYAGWTFVGWEQLLAASGVEFWSLLFQSIKYVPLLFVATSIDWLLGVALGRAEDPKIRKLLAVGTVIVNVGILVFFKYWNWGADTFIWIANTLFGVQLPDIRLRVDLPIGISFFCFMSLSYVIDVYRRTIPYCKSYLNYLTYISFFPHLVAGPIIRGRDLLPHLERSTKLTAETGGEGLFLIASGLIKKVAIGDYLAINLVDRVFAEPASYSSVEVMTAMYAYAVQVYCDFSGYSDIAIGSALLLGYRFKINFDAPFKSLNIVEFWRRWHISLSTWLRDYVYFSMGGGRVSRPRKYFNIFITMVVCGVWHGAAWTFVIFGAIQGIALAVTHYFQELRGKKPGAEEKISIPVRILCVAACFTFVALTFTMFRAASMDLALAMYERLLTFTTYTPNLHRNVVLIILAALVLQWTPRRIYDRVREAFIAAPAPAQAAALFGVAWVLREAASSEAVPFVYFQF